MAQRLNCISRSATRGEGDSRAWRTLEHGLHGSLAFDHFRVGLNSTGLTSCFTGEDLKALFSRFRTVQIERKTVHDDDDRILSEVYMVKATK